MLLLYPQVGDKFVCITTVNTVAEVTADKVVLVHPLMPEWHLPIADFVALVVRGRLTPEPRA